MFAIIITTLVFLVSTIGFAIIIYNDSWGDPLSIILGILFGILITLITSLFIWIPSAGITPGDANTKIVETDEPVAVVALNDNLSLEGYTGSFYRTGYVDEELYYYYFYEDGEVLRQGKIPAEQTSIVFGDEPCVVEQHWKVYKGFYKGLDVESTYILTVPAGSITEDITLDLE